MNKEKQIEEMTEIIYQNTEFDTMIPECIASAEALYNAGYRKASDVAREIFGEMIQLLSMRMGIMEVIAELKKKYAEGEE